MPLLLAPCLDYSHTKQFCCGGTALALGGKGCRWFLTWFVLSKKEDSSYKSKQIMEEQVVKTSMKGISFCVDDVLF